MSTKILKINLNIVAQNCVLRTYRVTNRWWGIFEAILLGGRLRFLFGIHWKGYVVERYDTFREKIQKTPMKTGDVYRWERVHSISNINSVGVIAPHDRTESSTIAPFVLSPSQPSMRCTEKRANFCQQPLTSLARSKTGAPPVLCTTMRCWSFSFWKVVRFQLQYVCNWQNRILPRFDFVVEASER